jgi:ABC-type Mn2+/Zn2+ transport system ATPase subunit
VAIRTAQSLTETSAVSARAAASARQLCKSYGEHIALQDVTIDIPAGALYAVLGPNGSGKSTLLRILMGLEQPTEGSVEVLGGPPARARDRIGYVPQASAADWSFPITVYEVVAMGLYGVRRRVRWPMRREPRVLEALARVGMEGHGQRQIQELSGGQQRRVLLGRALARDPELLLLDEPAAGLDVAADEELTATLRTFTGNGRTVVVATHDIGGVGRYYDHAVLIARRVIADGPVAEVLRDENLHAAFGRQLLAVHGVEHDRHHDVTFRQEHQ